MIVHNRPRALLATAVLTLLLASAAQARTIDQILAHHVANMKSGNLSGVMNDYAPDAVVVTPAGMVSPNGVFTGHDVRKLFSVLTDKTHLPGNKSMLTRNEAVAPDTAIMHWVQRKGTPQEVSGYDVFVVRDSKIAFQAVIVKGTK